MTPIMESLFAEQKAKLRAYRMPEVACVGCDAESAFHPYVALMANGVGFVSRPICLRCWENPQHRKRIVKAHFFAKSMEQQALARAGSSNIGG